MARESSDGPDAPFEFRDATGADLPDIVALLRDDPLGNAREDADGDLTPYRQAFSAIEADPNNRVIVMVKRDAPAVVLGVLQLTLIPNLTYGGAWRAQIEGVRVAASARGQGLGAALFKHAIQAAAAHPCVLVQLTTDKKRPDALRFYESLGFVASHEGMKLRL